MNKETLRLSFRIVLLLGTVISLFYVPWILVKAWLLPLPDSVQKQAEEAVSHGFDGIIIYVDQAGKPAQYYLSGWSDRDKKIAPRPQDLFKIASIHKLYVAVAISKLAADQRLSLDKTLADYFPELRDKIEYSDEITIENMVQHRSGIPNYTDFSNYWANPPEETTAKLDLILGLPANFTPNSSYEYSNTNYLLLGELMNRVLGHSYQQYIKESILQPLGLNDTYFSLDEIDKDRLMGGYYVGVEENIKTNDYGSMIATADDVGNFVRALNDGSVFLGVSQESGANVTVENNEAGEIKTPGKNAVDIYSDIYVYEHGGLIPGYQSLVKYHHDLDTVVVQFINTSDLNGYDWNLSQIIYSRVESILRAQR